MAGRAPATRGVVSMIVPGRGYALPGGRTHVDVVSIRWACRANEVGDLEDASGMGLQRWLGRIIDEALHKFTRTATPRRCGHGGRHLWPGTALKDTGIGRMKDAVPGGAEQKLYGGVPVATRVLTARDEDDIVKLRRRRA